MNMYRKKGYVKGKNHPLWKGDNASYPAIHTWLISNFGKADCCENEDCFGISKNYEWALIKGKEYSHDRESFIKLCRSCHHKYDMTDEIRKKISLATKKNYICTMVNCGKPYLAKGLCNAHYLKMWKKLSVV